jgi:hypothetical protein
LVPGSDADERGVSLVPSSVAMDGASELGTRENPLLEGNAAENKP